MTTKTAAWIAGGAAVAGVGLYFYRRRKNGTAQAQGNGAVPASFEVEPNSYRQPDNLVHFPGR